MSLVIPVYRNEASLPELLDALRGLHQALKGGLEVVLQKAVAKLKGARNA